MSTRNELLADHFMQAAGTAAVYVTDAGAIGGADTAGLFCPRGRVVLCCARGNHAKVATLAGDRVSAKAGQADALAAVHAAAAELGSGLTPFETVIRRAFAALGAVNQR